MTTLHQQSPRAIRRGCSAAVRRWRTWVSQGRRLHFSLARTARREHAADYARASALQTYLRGVGDNE